MKRNTRIRRERDPIPWKYCLLTLVCGLVLVAGFFWAARLHFSSIEYGIKNAKLRRQVEELKTEKRLSILRREMALSGVSKVARKIGFRKRTVNNIEVVRDRTPARKDIILATSRDDLNRVKTFTNSDTLAKGKRMKLREIEKKITKTVINESRRKNRDTRTDENRGSRSDIRERTVAVLAKKR
jgi:hypothetical protein